MPDKSDFKKARFFFLADLHIGSFSFGKKYHPFSVRKKKQKSRGARGSCVGFLPTTSPVMVQCEMYKKVHYLWDHHHISNFSVDPKTLKEELIFIGCPFFSPLFSLLVFSPVNDLSLQ